MAWRARSVVATWGLAALSACREPAGAELPVPAARAAPSPELSPGALDQAGESPWTSREACEKLVARGVRAHRAAGRARLGTWNIRWFPDGKPGKRVQSAGTDLAWLGCAIAW